MNCMIEQLLILFDLYWDLCTWNQIIRKGEQDGIITSNEAMDLTSFIASDEWNRRIQFEVGTIIRTFR